MDPRLRQAVEDNVAWCDEVSRSHGVATTLDDDRWWAASRTPPRYPDVITRSPGLVDVDRLFTGVDAGPGCSVKDSFATLDLRPAGFEVLVDARWLFLGSAERSDVVGLVNIEGDVEAAWRDAAATNGGRPIVGYESGDALTAALAAGAVELGPLRVWLRPD